MRWQILGIYLILFLGNICSPVLSALSPEPPPLFQEFCFDCHGDGSKKGGVSFDHTAFTSPEDQRKFWFDVWRNLDAELMPPSDKPRPTQEQRAALQAWVEANPLHLNPAKPDPGRVTIRRLNREEYRNTIRDLTGVDYPVQEHFPPDDTGYGFDTIGDVLNLSPIHLEKYLAAAKEIVASALAPANSLRVHLVPEGPPPLDSKERAAYTQSIIRSFAEKALRRPVDAVTLSRLSALAGGDFDQGLRDAFVAVLASPRFLFRAEVQTAEDKPGENAQVDEFALASRLSYFLWSSMPDKELWSLAQKGLLRSQWEAQLKRMLADPKIERFSRNFVGQWLQTRDTEAVPIQVNAILGVKKREEQDKIFPFKLRHAMRLETEMLFSYVLRKGLPSEELLTARYSFLASGLAKFYGLTGVTGSEVRKVQLPEGSHRQGILGHGSFLLLTSNPTRTSPVKRGLFLLENVLGTPAPPPPPNIPPLEGVADGKKLGMREMMVLHRSEALCASCHARMDPLGLALENFNAIGQYQEPPADKPVDLSGQLVTGEKFQTLPELVTILATSRRHDFYRCLSEKMLTYALGRGLDATDIPHIKRLVEAQEKPGGNLMALVKAVTESVPFQFTRPMQSAIANAPAPR